MLRLSLECADCGYSESNIDTSADYMLVGQCPRCGDHHGNIMYFAEMSASEFIEELAKMEESDIAKRSLAIKLIAESLVEDGGV
jgi:NAD-dependent SIR2 family protein deacetylase